ncbi:MAG: lytic murein transglycosylase B [Proteobacteria bacterium]|nr:lytic murein transglycosylase B [Pseudomonadota bacterium]
MRRGFAVIHSFLLCAALTASASTPAAPDPGAAEQQFAQTMAREHGLDAAAVLETLHRATYRQSVIDTMTRPAEAKPWKDYRTIFVTPRRIADGAQFYRDHRALLERTAGQYGLPPEMIAAIIGVESNYGRTPMRYRVLDALVTLAFYYPPRQDYFRSELAQLLLLHSAAFPYAPEDLMGSYAGAMGWPQFMPSSVAKYARDGDGDGKIDLWNSLPDICASIANYFEAFGWQTGAPVALRADVAATARAIDPKGLDPVYPLQQLAEWGYTTNQKLDPATPATLIRLEGDDGPQVWITFRNFWVISRYNKSPLYALAVYQLSEAIAAAARTP